MRLFSGSLNSNSLKIATYVEKYTIQADTIRRIQLSRSSFGISSDAEIQSGFVEVRTANPSLHMGTFNSSTLVLYLANNHTAANDVDCVVYLFYKY